MSNETTTRNDILVLERSGNYYGAAQNLLHWVKFFQESKSIHVVLGSDGDFVKELSHARVKFSVEKLPLSIDVYGKGIFSKNIFKVIRNGFLWFWYNIKLLKKLPSHKCIVVNNTRTFFYYFWYILCSKLVSQKKVVWRIQNDHNINFFIKKIFLSISNEVIVHGTENVKFKIFGYTRSTKIHVLKNPINLNNFAYKREYEKNSKVDHFVIVCVGALEERKGQWLLINYISEVIKCTDTNVRLELLGGDNDNGTTLKALKELSAKLGIKDSVIFTGKVKDVRPWLIKADVFVLLSSNETMTYAVSEAMAIGLPVITTDVGAHSYLIENEISGYILSSRNNKQEFICIINSLIDSPSLRLNIGKQARLAIEKKLSEDQYFDNLDKIL